MRVASSSRWYHWQSKRVIEGNKHPSKKPSKILVMTSDGKFWMKPVQRHTIPQQKVIVGMTLLNCRRLTRTDVGNCSRQHKCSVIDCATYLREDVEDIEYGHSSLQMLVID